MVLSDLQSWKGLAKNPGTVWTNRRPAAATEPIPEDLVVVVLRVGQWSPRRGHVVLEGDARAFPDLFLSEEPQAYSFHP